VLGALKTSDRNLKVYSKKPKVKRLFDTLPVEPRDSAANAGYTPEPEEDEGYDMGADPTLLPSSA
jgi:hypothetical protein